MKNYIIICLAVCAVCLAAQETEKAALLCKELTAETSFPAFNRQVSGENGTRVAIRVWQAELPALDIKNVGPARYTLSICTKSMDCWQVGLRNPQQEILLAKVVLQLQVEDTVAQSKLLEDSLIGYAISESLQSEALKSLLDAWQNSLVIAARTLQQKLNPATATPLLKIMFADEKEYIATNYGSMGMFAPIIPNPIQEIQIYKIPDLPKLYLSSYPPVLRLNVKGLDSYGDEVGLDVRKVRFLLYDGKKQTLLPRAEFKPWRVGQFSVRAVYPGNKEREIESPAMQLDVTRIEELLIAPSEITIAPQESYTFEIAGRGSEGQELSVADLEAELEWKVVPSEMAEIDKGVVKAGVASGTCRLVVSAKSNPQVRVEAQILIRDKK